MKLSIPASEIKTAIQGLARVKQTGHLPVLNCVHFAVDAASIRHAPQSQEAGTRLRACAAEAGEGDHGP